MKNIFTILGLVLVMSVPAMAQQAVQYSMYMWNKYAFNPAYAGLDNSLSITGVFRSQWSGLAGNPESQHLNAHMPLYIAGGGAGIALENDKTGSWKQTAVMLSYDYQVVMGDAGVLSLGLGAGYIQRELDGSLIRTPDGIYNEETGTFEHNDPNLPFGTGSDRGAAPEVNLGAFYQGERLEIGISAMNLLENELSFSSLSFRSARNFYLYSGYKMDLGKKLSVQPSVLVKSDVDQTQIDFSVLMTYNENIFGGASFRGYNADSRDGVALIAGFKLSEKMSFGYSYDLTLSGLNTVSNGTHELMLNYNLGKPIGKGKPPVIIYNPRSL